MNKISSEKRRMFNKDLKNQYVKYAISLSESQKPDLYERGIVNRFIRSEELEAHYGKDICEMNREEVKVFLKEFLCGGTLYQANTISTFRSYVEWAIANNHTPIKSNPFFGINPTDIDVSTPYADTMVKDEDELMESLNTVLEDIRKGTPDNAKWCVFLLLFAGADFKEIFYIKKEDVNMNEKIIKCLSQTIDISDNLEKAIHYCFEIDGIYKGGKGESEYEKPIIDEGYLISNTRSYGKDRDKMRLSFTSDISLIMSDGSKKLKPSSINDSGVFHRMHIKEVQTGQIDYTEYLTARKYQKSVINFPDRVKKQCLHEYETWKRAFGL